MSKELRSASHPLPIAAMHLEEARTLLEEADCYDHAQQAEKAMDEVDALTVNVIRLLDER